MARGSTLTALIAMLRIEIGASSDPSKGISERDSLIQSLNAEYLRLHEDFDWPFLSGYEIKLSQAGSRYYDVPTTLIAERITSVSVKVSNRWQGTTRRISLDNYNIYDPDEDQRSDPIQCWDVYGANQIEVWPLPATNDIKIRIDGIKKVSPMISGSDVCLLDDKLVVYFAAAEILRRKKKKDADEVLIKANAQYKTAKGRIHGIRSFNLNSGKTSNKKVQIKNVTWQGNP
jgi:hypothetical protein